MSSDRDAEDLCYELRKYTLGAVPVIVHRYAEGGLDAYTTNGTTTDPAEAADADGILYPHGEREEIVYRTVEEADSGYYRLYHPYAGLSESAATEFSEAVTLLRELDRPVLASDGGASA